MCRRWASLSRLWLVRGCVALATCSPHTAAIDREYCAPDVNILRFTTFAHLVVFSLLDFCDVTITASKACFHRNMVTKVCDAQYLCRTLIWTHSRTQIILGIFVLLKFPAATQCFQICLCNSVVFRWSATYQSNHQYTRCLWISISQCLRWIKLLSGHRRSFVLLCKYCNLSFQNLGFDF